MDYIKNKNTEVLELNKIIEKLMGQTTMDASKIAVSKIEPSYDYDTVKSMLCETDDACTLLLKHSPPGFSGAEDVSFLVNQAYAGVVLSKGELLSVGRTLKTARDIRTWRDDIDIADSIMLDRLFFLLYCNSYLEDKIFFCIKNEDEINDRASQRLFDIRRKIKSAENSIRTRLDKIVRSESNGKLIQDAIITQRDGRFVIPVKAEYRSQFSGLVHGTSTSGATVFIEPMAVVEINNEIRVLLSEEQDEINKILADLSDECAKVHEEIAECCKALCELDVIFAKARLGLKMNAAIPKINNCGIISLKSARHPLIDSKKVVPISVDLGKEYDSLIVTGPNTGGKTVTLKTIGLLCLMTMCGMMIPAKETSEIAVFSNIFADIGDEQSIEQSLSTFSSHMTNIVFIVNQSGKNTLVLLDELGAGTDPIEGAALAQSILQTLKDKGAKIAATTHYAELKSYAINADRVQNASCEFDVATLQPTYRLMVGIPGRSNAFAISKKLGLPQSIIDNADGMLSNEQKRFEEIVETLDTARRQAENEKEEVARLRVELARQKEELEQKKNESFGKNSKAIESAREQAQYIIENTRREANTLINELTQLKKEINRKNANEALQKAKALERKSFEAIKKHEKDAVNKKDTGIDPDRPYEVGDRVYITTFDSEGVVEAVSDNKKTVTVSFGAANMRVDAKSLKLITAHREQAPQKKLSGDTSKALSGVASELDMRGLACDEGIMMLDSYLDNVVLAKLETVRIIHGKGTGVLRNAVRNHLKHHKAVDSIRPGMYGEGEDGVTVVTMKK